AVVGLEVVVQAQLIPSAVRVIQSARGLLTTALVLRRDDRRITIEQVGDVEARYPGTARRGFTRVVEHKVGSGLRSSPVVIHVTTFHPQHVVHGAVDVTAYQAHAVRT